MSSRRWFLKRVAATGLAAGLAGCSLDDPVPSPTPTPTPTETERSPTPRPTTPDRPRNASTERAVRQQYADRFDSFVNIADAGANIEGTARIDGVLENAVGNDTLVFFPKGTYRLGSFEVSNVDNAGFVSAVPTETTIVPAAPAAGMNHLFLRFLDVRDFLLDGFEFDFRKPGFGGATQVISRGDFVARNLRVRGRMPDKSQPNNPAAFRFDVREKSGSGLVANVTARDGGHDGGNAVGIYVGKDHAGELTFENCTIENFPNNGLYASSPGRETDGFSGADGTVHVKGGLYKNNNIANVRLGTTDSTARNVTIVVDDVPPSPGEKSLNVRGLRLRGKHGQVVENCRIVFGANAATGFGALVFHPATGTATVRDTEIRVDRNGIHAVNALPPNDTDDSVGPAFQNVHVTGSAEYGRAVAIKGRDGTEFRNCTIEQPGKKRSGILFVDADDCLVADTTIKVTGQPIRTVNSSIQRKNLTLERWDGN